MGLLIVSDRLSGLDARAYRLGGEEFVLVLDGRGEAETMELAERVRKELEEMQIHYQGQALGSVTASMGVATSPQPVKESRHLLGVADKAMYRAKNGGAQSGRKRITLRHGLFARYTGFYHVIGCSVRKILR